MKSSVKRFKNLKLCLKELGPCILDGEHLQTGKPFKNFGNLRSREILGCWLLCVVYNFESRGDRASLCTDPMGGDGILYDNTERKPYLTEHVLVPRNNPKHQDIELLILQAIENKQRKGGAAYASGKNLIVFVDTYGGEWYPNRLGRKIGKKLNFESVYIIGLRAVVNGEYIYYVTCLDPSNCPIWLVRINKTFTDWQVSCEQ